MFILYFAMSIAKVVICPFCLYTPLNQLLLANTSALSHYTSHTTYDVPGWGINRKVLPFFSQSAYSTPNLLDSCVASFLLLVRYTECEQAQENRFRSSCANSARLGTLADGRSNGCSVPSFDPWHQKGCWEMGLRTQDSEHIAYYICHGGYIWLWSQSYSFCLSGIFRTGEER